MEFLKQDEIKLINGGYLSNKEGKPVTNESFVKAQESAHYFATLAEKAKSKDFVGKIPDSKEQLFQEVDDLIFGLRTVKFVDTPKKPEQKITEKLKKEALDFILHGEASEKTEKINSFMQPFAVVKDFEEFGLFFEPGVVKLNKIYTLEEIIDAVTEIIDLV